MAAPGLGHPPMMPSASCACEARSANTLLMAGQHRQAIMRGLELT